MDVEPPYLITYWSAYVFLKVISSQSAFPAASEDIINTALKVTGYCNVTDTDVETYCSAYTVN